MVQQVIAWFVLPSGMLENVDERMEFWSVSVDAVEAKKAEGASDTALLIHKPPAFTGRWTCDHWMSSRSPFNILMRPSLRTVSNLVNSGLSLHGHVLRMYNNLSMRKLFRRRLRVLWACSSDNRPMALVRSSFLVISAMSMAGPLRIGAPSNVMSTGLI